MYHKFVNDNDDNNDEDEDGKNIDGRDRTR